MNKRLILTLSVLLILIIAIPLVAQDDEAEEELPDCPVFEDQSTEVRTSYYMGEGLGYLRSNQLSSAIFSFTCIIRVIDEDYVPAYMTRAVAFTRQRDYEAAIEDYTSAIDLDSSLIQAYNNRGVAYVLLTEFQEAKADFDQVLELDSSNVAGVNNRSVLHILEDEFDEAIALLEQAVDISGIDDVYAELTNPDRPNDAPEVEFDRNDARSYALLGIVRSAQALDEYQKYLFLTGNGADSRIQSAAGAMESRFTFELRLDDGSWLLTLDFSPTGEDED